MFRVCNPVFNLGFRVHSLVNKGNLFFIFSIRDNESDQSRRVVRLDGKFAEEERERET
jgi:hypothetical protein